MLKDKKEKGPKTADLTAFKLKDKLCKVPANAGNAIEDKTTLTANNFSSTCAKDYASIVAIQDTKAMLKDFIDGGLLDGMEELITVTP